MRNVSKKEDRDEVGNLMRLIKDENILKLWRYHNSLMSAAFLNIDESYIIIVQVLFYFLFWKSNTA